uniref:Uncharacterized protein n=1 Tax=viral metagenome TaxID=1070528 RepID=A0A6H2A6D8_9ZZZZ
MIKSHTELKRQYQDAMSRHGATPGEMSRFRDEVVALSELHDVRFTGANRLDMLDCAIFELAMRIVDGDIELITPLTWLKNAKKYMAREQHDQHDTDGVFSA